MSMIEAKKMVFTNALKEAKRFCKEFGFNCSFLKDF